MVVRVECKSVCRFSECGDKNEFPEWFPVFTIALYT